MSPYKNTRSGRRAAHLAVADAIRTDGRLGPDGRPTSYRDSNGRRWHTVDTSPSPSQRRLVCSASADDEPLSGWQERVFARLGLSGGQP